MMDNCVSLGNRCLSPGGTIKTGYPGGGIAILHFREHFRELDDDASLFYRNQLAGFGRPAFWTFKAFNGKVCL